MSPVGIPEERITESFPRVSGDEPVIVRSPLRRTQFSPRERG